MVCFGNASLDDCNECTGGNTGKVANYLMDECGVCNGTNTTCTGCDGIPNSGLRNDACEECGGDGSTCTEIMATMPQTIASSQPIVWVIGAGLNGGSRTVCGLYDAESGDLVVNTTASERNLTHASCEFQPWENYTVGVYNLSVTIVHDNEMDVKTNNSLPVYYYSSQDLFLTNVIPAEVLKGDPPEYVTLNGSGFFDWKETVCYFGSQETRDVIYNNETHLECKVPSVSASTRFSVSLSMDGGLVKVGDTTLTVFANAPNVSEVRFSDTAGELLVDFDIDVEITSGVESCQLFLASETIVMLGVEPECFLLSTRELMIVLGYDANITTSDVLVFNDNVFKAHSEQYSRYLSGSFPVNAPATPLKPTPVITGPGTLSSCGNLTLSGLQSSGGGGRPLVFQWVLESPNSGPDVTAINSVLSGISNDDRVDLPGTVFDPDKVYEFKLKVATFLSPTSFEEITHSITKATEPVPALTLSSSIDLNEGEVFVSDGLSIKASAVVAPCVNNTKVDFSWSVTCTVSSAQQKVESSALFLATRNQAIVRIDQGVLTGGVTCTFNVTGSMNYNPNVKSMVSTDIKALPSPLEPAIFGGDRQIGRASGIIMLDAESLTLDPDQTTDPYACQWRCEVVSGGTGFCYSASERGRLIFGSISGCDTTVQSSEFEAGKSYKITADVSKGSRSASASVVLTVIEGAPPDVWLDVAFLKVKASDRVQLLGFYKTSVEPVKVEWTSSQEQGFSFVDLTGLNIITEYSADNDSFVQMILPANLLRPGSQYRFKLAVDDGSKEGVASVVVEVRTGPTSGSFSVQPTSVKALETVAMSAKQWITDSDAGPLRYAFGELIGEDICEIYRPPSSDPETREIISQGSGPNNILQLCVVVVDKFDSFAIATVNITSSPPDAADLTPDALDSLFEDAIEDKLQSGEADAAVGALIAIADTVLGSTDASAELKANISKKAQEVILNILDSTTIDKDSAAPLLTALVKTDATAAENSSGMAQAAVSILKGFENTPLTNDKAEDLMEWMGDLAGESLENDTSLKETVKDFFLAMANSLDEQLFLGDPPREVSKEGLGSIKVEYTTLQSAVVTSSKPGASSFNPGSSLSNLFKGPRKCGQGKTCSGTVLELLQFDRNLITENEDQANPDVEVDNSKVTSIELKDPVTKEPQSVTNLPDPLEVTFNKVSPPPDGKKFGCNFFDTEKQAWVQTDLTLEDIGNNTLVCKSNHLTTFAPSHDSLTNTSTAATTPTVEANPTEKEDKDMTGAIVGGVIGGLVLILVVVLGVWYCSKQKKKNSGRISPEDPLEPAPVD